MSPESVDRADEEEKPRAKPARARAADEEETVSAAAPPAEPAGTLSHNFDFVIGAHVYGRSFKYNQSYSGRQDAYVLPVVPSPALAVDYYFLPSLGFTFGGEYAVGLRTPLDREQEEERGGEEQGIEILHALSA